MLRLSREDDSLWVCDLPRRCDEQNCLAIAARLASAGFQIRSDNAARLWRIDLAWTDELFLPPAVQPAFPRDERLHPAYGLYRLLSTRTFPMEAQPKPLLRAILKLTLQPPGENGRRTTELHCQCAALLNQKRPLPSAAANALAQYICQEVLQ